MHSRLSTPFPCLDFMDSFYPRYRFWLWDLESGMARPYVSFINQGCCYFPSPNVHCGVFLYNAPFCWFYPSKEDRPLDPSGRVMVPWSPIIVGYNSVATLMFLPQLSRRVCPCPALPLAFTYHWDGVKSRGCAQGLRPCSIPGKQVFLGFILGWKDTWDLHVPRSAGLPVWWHWCHFVVWRDLSGVLSWWLLQVCLWHVSFSSVVILVILYFSYYCK